MKWINKKNISILEDENFCPIGMVYETKDKNYYWEVILNNTIYNGLCQNKKSGINIVSGYFHIRNIDIIHYSPWNINKDGKIYISCLGKHFIFEGRFEEESIYLAENNKFSFSINNVNCPVCASNRKNKQI